MSEERTPAIKFKLEQPVKGTFIFDDPLTGEGTRNGETYQWFMYKFKNSFDDEQVFFASKGLQKKLSEAGNLAEKKFTITKVLMKDENGNIKEDKRGNAMNSFDLEFEGEEFPPAE